MFEGQVRLPALSNFSMIKQFLKTDIKYCILVDFQLAEIGDIISDLKSHGRKILVHIDMIKGLSADEFGAIHLIQNYRVDGIISIKPKVIAICKKRRVIAMQRIFLKDSISLKRSLEIIGKTKPYLTVVGSLIEAMTPAECPHPLVGAKPVVHRQMRARLIRGSHRRDVVVEVGAHGSV